MNSEPRKHRTDNPAMDATTVQLVNTLARHDLELFRAGDADHLARLRRLRRAGRVHDHIWFRAMLIEREGLA